MAPAPDHDPLAAALAYLERDWVPIPVRPYGKRPLVRWEPYQHRHPEPAELRDWFEHWPEANVGLVTGRISGLVVLDVDPKHEGDQSLAGLERRHGPLQATVTARSGGGGRHLYFAHPGAEVRNLAGFAPGLDLRGDGGFVVAPPSRHASGGVYAWEPGRDPDSLEPAPMPLWIGEAGKAGGRPAGHSVGFWRELLDEGVGEGRRNVSIASLTGHLLWHGVDTQVAIELLLCWNRVRCRPPLDDEEVVRTVLSVERTHRRRLSEL